MGLMFGLNCVMLSIVPVLGGLIIVVFSINEQDAHFVYGGPGVSSDGPASLNNIKPENRIGLRCLRVITVLALVNM